jgi:predicted O-methyltransferase YrrM
MTRDELLALAEVARGRVVLEVGAYLGRSTVTLASVAERVHSVDPHFPDRDGFGYVSTAIPLIENLARHGLRERVIIHVGWSYEVLPLYPEGFFDLAFIDAAHQRECVERDLGLARRVVRPGGALLFHDYGTPGCSGPDGWEAFGVTEVVDEYVAENGGTLEVVGSLALLRS